MNLIRNNLLNCSALGGAFLSSPDDGAGAVSGEAAPAAAPAAPAAPTGQTENQKAGVGETQGFSESAEADGESEMFSMPADDSPLFTLDETGEAAPPAPKGKEATPAATPAAAPAPADGSAPAAGTQPPQATPPAAAPPTAGTGTAAPAVPPAPQGTPPAPEAAPVFLSPHQEFLNQVDQNREALSQQLEGVYAISDQDAEAMGLVDKAPLQRMAANLHVNVMRATANMLLQTLPTSIAQIVDYMNRTEKAIGDFYTENPELSRATDHAVVDKYAKLFWQANPKGTLADFNKQVGMMAKAELNKLVAQAQASPPAAPGVQPKKVAPQAKPSFTPATPQGGTPANARGPATGTDVWGSLAERILNGDE